jgi:hypothetical protein
MVLFRKKGTQFWGSNNTMTLSLVKEIEDEIRKQEKNGLGIKIDPKPADIKTIMNKKSEYDIHDPWQAYSHFQPGASEEHLQRLERAGIPPPPPPPPPPPAASPSFSLEEGDKAMSS